MGPAGAACDAQECWNRSRSRSEWHWDGFGHDGSRYGVFGVSLGNSLAPSDLHTRSPCRNLYSTFITPWADQSAARIVEPDFHLPTCYINVQAPPPGPAKASAFSDETLFFMFYSSPRDALQEVAAQELCVFYRLCSLDPRTGYRTLY